MSKSGIFKRNFLGIYITVLKIYLYFRRVFLNVDKIIFNFMMLLVFFFLDIKCVYIRKYLEY